MRRPRQLQPYDDPSAGNKATNIARVTGIGTGGRARDGCGDGATANGDEATAAELMDTVRNKYEQNMAIKNWQYQLTCDKF